MNKFFLLIILTMAGCSSQEGPFSFVEWQKKNQGSYSYLLDRQGLLLQEGRIEFNDRQLGWHGIQSFPTVLQNELIAFEDKNFRQHSGVDWSSLLGNGARMLRGEKPRGASTITMQLVNLLNPQLRQESNYKFKQIRRAQWLENQWTKDQILEAYFNRVPLRGELRGFPAAARIFYGKSHQELFLQERLWLYSLLPSPNASFEKLQERACRYGKRLDPQFDCLQLVQFRPIMRVIKPESLAPHLFAELPSNTKTTIDKALQLKAMEVLNRHVDQLRLRNVKDGAVLIADRQNGEVLAYVGGANAANASSHVNHVRALRQAGSVLKPFLYAEAIQSKILTMDSPLLDAPFAISSEGFNYRPENHDRRFLHRPVPLKEALGSSLNIPAIRAIDLVTPTRFYQLLVSLGFQLPYQEDYYGHSMALGAVDISLLHLVQAFLYLADGPKAKHLTATFEQKTLPAVFDQQTSFILGQILSEKTYRAHSFGLDSILNTSSWSAVKTGTSKDMRDNWCIGFTDRYVVGVWVGNSSGESMWDVMGITGAGPVWRELVEYLHKDHASLPPQMPVGLVQRGESYFLEGTEPLQPDTQLLAKQLPRILSPTAFGQYAYDPDVPARSQKILLKTEGITSPRWRLNGKFLTPEMAAAGLAVEKKGKYLLELLDQSEKKLDEVKFYVKAGKLGVPL